MNTVDFFIYIYNSLHLVQPLLKAAVRHRKEH